MRKVGHHTKANIIQNWYNENADNFCGPECIGEYFQSGEYCSYCGDGETEPLPTGFSVLSNGCYRIAFLHAPTGVVYKIEHCPGDDDYGNLAEKRNYRALMKRANADGHIGTYIRVPITTMYGDVIAMEYIPRGGGSPIAAVREMQKIGLTDIHPGNYIYDGNRLNIIDMAAEYFYEAV